MQRRLNHTAVQGIGYLVKDKDERVCSGKGSRVQDSQQGFRHRIRCKGAQGILRGLHLCTALIPDGSTGACHPEKGT